MSAGGLGLGIVSEFHAGCDMSWI